MQFAATEYFSGPRPSSYIPAKNVNEWPLTSMVQFHNQTATTVLMFEGEISCAVDRLTPKYVYTDMTSLLQPSESLPVIM